jgi:hypothetical protein
MGVSICIHRAAQEIGGNCIEIRASSGERLLLDAGRPLDTPEGEETPADSRARRSLGFLGGRLSEPEPRGGWGVAGIEGLTCPGGICMSFGFAEYVL